MERKRSILLDVPPAASSGEDETTTYSDEQEEEEESSSSEEPQTQNPSVQNSNPKSESESETGTEIDSDSDMNSIALMPAKRGNQVVESDAKEPFKRAKREEEEEEEEEETVAEKKQLLFQRLWSEDDEIAVLKGIIDFTEKKGIDPAKDMNMNLFCDFIKPSLHFNVSLSQLKDKLSRLKKRFKNHLSKGNNNTFSKPHDQKLFDLSKMIWGLSVKKPMRSSNGNNDNNISRSEKLAALKAELGERVEVVDVGGISDYVIERGLDMVEASKRAEMEEKWRDLHVAELELFLKRNELIREQAMLLLASYK